VATPVVALAIVAIGLRVGAPSRVRGARVYAASPGAGREGLALQVATITEEGPLSEVIPMAGLTVVASARGGRAEWRGESNAEGVAEAWLALARVRAGDSLSVSVSAADGSDLATGVVELPASGSGPPATFAAVTATHRSGALALDVFIDGGKLVPDASGTVAVRVRDVTAHHGVDGVTLTITPEFGLSIDQPFAPTSSGGWTQARVTADGLVATWTLSAASASPPAQAGTWYGELPVSPGAAAVNLPTNIPAGAPFPLDVVLPPSSRRLYVAVNDAVGRDFGAALEATASRKGASASLVIPPLAPGVYWLVTSSDPRASGPPTGSALARPFRAGPPVPGLQGPPLAELALLSPPCVSMSLVLDGLAAPREHADRARRRGLHIALGALAVATLLEVLLILRAARRTQRRLSAVSEAARDAGVDALETGPGAGAGVAILLAVTLLGFAFLAALMTMRAGG
jgi:hypothetical protein